MNTVAVVMRAGLRDLSRNHWIAAYAFTLFLTAQGFFWFGGPGPQVALSLLNVELMLVPLVSLIFGAIHVYSSREFLELLLAQPISRRGVFAGLYLGLAVPLALAFVVGMGLPLAMQAGGGTSPGAIFAILTTGVALSFTFAGVAVLVALLTDDRVKGIGLALGVWLLATLAYDGAVLAVTAGFAAWPLEKPMLAMMLANPVDLARVVVLTQLDAAALMGYTGALFNRAFGTPLGVGLAAFTLALWCAATVALAARRFRFRDF